MKNKKKISIAKTARKMKHKSKYSPHQGNKEITHRKDKLED